jgi:hypothetical protein
LFDPEQRFPHARTPDFYIIGEGYTVGHGLDHIPWFTGVDLDG